MTVKINIISKLLFHISCKNTDPQNEVAFVYMLIFTLQPYLSRKMK